MPDKEGAVQVAFHLDLSRCVGCHSCALACKAWHNLEPDRTAAPGESGVRYRQVHHVEAGESPDIEIVHVSLSCMHCEEPACQAVCPNDAIIKRPEDGIVVVDRDRCNGCGACADACPFDVPQFNADGTMGKCDYCLDRVEQGLDPACVATCPTGAIRAGTFEALSAQYPHARRIVSGCKPCLLVSR